MDPGLAAFGAKVSASEGNFTSVNKWGCVGAFQFCPGTFSQYSNGETTQQFANDPQQQVQSWTQYMQDQNAIAQKGGLYNSVGQQVCYQGQCATITQSSILMACQFGCGPTGKLANFENTGSCTAKGSVDGSGTSVCAYLIRGAGYDVSAVTGTPSNTNANKTTQASSTSTQTQQQTTQGQQQQTQQQGQTTGATTTAQNTPSNGQSTNMGPAGSLNAIGDPTVCWICDAVIHAMGVSEALLTSSTATLVADFWPLVTSLAMMSLIYAVLRCVLTGANPMGAALPILGRFALVAAVTTAGTIGGSSGSAMPDDTTQTGISVNIADGATANGSVSGSNYQTDLFYSPPIMLGAAFGTDLSTAAQTAVGMTVSTGNCSHDDPGSAGVKITLDAANQLVTLACQVHAFLSSGVQVGGLIVTHPERDGITTDLFTSLGVGCIGLFLMYVCFMALLTFGFALVEAVIVSGIVAVFLPVMLFAWCFESTRGMIRNAFDNMVFVLVYLTLSGLAAVVTMFVLLKSLQLGLGQGVTLTDPASFVSQFDSKFANLDVTQPTQMAALVRFTCATVAGGLLSSRVLSATHMLATEISGYALAQTAGLARSGPQMLSRVVSVATAFAGVGATVAAPLAGRLAGSVAGSLVRSAPAAPSSRRVAPPRPAARR